MKRIWSSKWLLRIKFWEELGKKIILSKMSTQWSVGKSREWTAHLVLSSLILNMRVLTQSLHQSLDDGDLQNHEAVTEVTLTR